MKSTRCGLRWNLWRRGWRVRVAESMGPQRAVIPNVVGQTQATAQSMITSALLVVGTITNAYSDTVAAGRVISQNPIGGSTANVGSAVNLTISDGPAPGGSWTLQRTSDLEMTISSPAPSFPITVSGSGSWTFYASGTTDWKIEISSVSGVGGTWTVNPPTGTVSSGSHTINFTIQGLNVNVSSLPHLLHGVTKEVATAQIGDENLAFAVSVDVCNTHPHEAVQLVPVIHRHGPEAAFLPLINGHRIISDCDYFLLAIAIQVTDVHPQHSAVEGLASP